MLRKKVFRTCSTCMNTREYHSTNKFQTRMHSSRMYTVRCSGRPWWCLTGGVSTGGVCPGGCLPRGVSAQSGCLPRGVSVCQGVCLPARGCLLRWVSAQGVSTQGSVCPEWVSAQGGVCLPGGCLPARGCLPRWVSAQGVSACQGVSAQGGVCLPQPSPVDRMTDTC